MRKVFFLVLFAVLSGYSIILTCCYFTQTSQVIFAEEQTHVIYQLKRNICSSGSNTEMAVKLEALTNYYPSGTKQGKGSRLDKLVENVRSNATEDVLDFLKKKTGKDFGPNPQIWIEKLKD